MLLNKGSHAGGGLQCLRPCPALAPASAWLRGSPPLPLGTLGEPRTRIRQRSESGGGGRGAWNSSPRQCTLRSFRRPRDSWLGWKRWLGGALCRSAAGCLQRRGRCCNWNCTSIFMLHRCTSVCFPGGGPCGQSCPSPRGCCMAPGPGPCRGGRRWVGGRLWRLSLVLVTLTPAPPRRGKGACFFAFLSFPPRLSLASPPSAGSPRGVFP